VRTDGRIVDDGEAFATDWQGEWEAKGQVVEDGWVVEIRIPFSNFQYDNAEEHTFGMLLDREQVHTQEWSNWTPDGVNSAKVSRYPHLTGLKGIAPRQIFSATPYLAAQVALPSSPLGGGGQIQQGLVPAQGQIFQPNAGVDARVDPVQWASLRLTLNPDFAQFDVDQDVLWLDTEERLVPERREFFRESEQLFIAPINLFFSRRIAPNRLHDRVLGGAQVVGKKYGLGFSLLDVQSQQVRSDGGTENVNAGVVRLQQDLGNRSSVSLLGLSRQGDASHRLLGADANLHIWEEWFVQVQAAKTWSPDPSPGAEAYHVGIHRFDTTSEYWLQFEDVGGNFKDPLGYVPVLDKQSLRAHAFNNFFLKLPLLERVDITWDGLIRRNHEGALTRHRENLLVQPYLNHRFALVLNGLYDVNNGYTNTIGTLGFIVDPYDWQSLSVQALYGTFLGGQFAGFNGALNLKIGPRVVVKLSAFYNKVSPTYSQEPAASSEVTRKLFWLCYEHLIFRAVEKLLPQGQRWRILDAGGGAGKYGQKMAELGHHVTVLDLSPGMLQQAQARFLAAGLEEGAAFQEGNILALPFADASFDLVFCEGDPVSYCLEEYPQAM